MCYIKFPYNYFFRLYPVHRGNLGTKCKDTPFPLSTFHRILEALNVQWRNPIPYFASSPGRRNENIKYFIRFPLPTLLCALEYSVVLKNWTLTSDFMPNFLIVIYLSILFYYFIGLCNEFTNDLKEKKNILRRIIMWEGQTKYTYKKVIV